MTNHLKTARSMLRTFNGGTGSPQIKPGEKRFSCIIARDSSTTELLHGCPVMTAAGETIGRVKSILIDAKTRQLRYVLLATRRGRASVAIPWHALYFDSALARLVFYTYS
jgi:PRC-barrel domain